MSSKIIEANPSNNLRDRHESESDNLARSVIFLITLFTDSSEPLPAEIRLSSRLLNMLSSDPDVSDSQQEIARRFNDKLKKNFPSALSQLYKSGKDFFFQNKKLVQIPQCTICSHESRDEIDYLILSGVRYYEIALSFNVSKKALSRHKIRHLQREER